MFIRDIRSCPLTIISSVLWFTYFTKSYYPWTAGVYFQICTDLGLFFIICDSHGLVYIFKSALICSCFSLFATPIDWCIFSNLH